MHWRHRFPMLFIKLSDTGIGSEDQTQSKPCFSSCNTNLEEDLRQQPLCQDNPKRCSIGFRSGDLAGHSIRSKP
ncbi:hypothetical protein TNCV_557441 [Trichonephila clavipes]|nr:hypothetical protein TNCV_557441 [Trichonephila clavipes]